MWKHCYINLFENMVLFSLEQNVETCLSLKLSHGNMAYVMIMLFINIEPYMIDNYLSKGFPGQLHEICANVLVCHSLK